MSLGTRAAVMIGATMAVLFLAFHAASTWVVRQSFSQLEARYIRLDTARVLKAIEGRQNDLIVTVSDWAMWDDAYRFAQDRNPGFVEANLAPEALETLQTQVLLIVDLEGNVIYGRTFDAPTPTEAPAPAGLVRLAAAGSRLAGLRTVQDQVAGVVLLDDGPVVVAACPVLPSKRDGPARGVLIMGRRLDAAEVQRLAEALQVKVAVFRADALSGRPWADEVLAALAGGEPSVTRVLDATAIAGYGLVRDLDGRPAIVIEARLPRDIFAHGRRTAAAFAGVLAIMGLLSTVAVVVLVRRQIVGRLERLGREVRGISLTTDLSQRVSPQGADELADLAVAVNRMLDRLATSRRALATSEERFRQVAETTADWIWEVDASGLYTYVSPAVGRVLGYTPGDLVGTKHFYDLFPPETRESLKQAAFGAFARKEPIRGLANANLRPDGRVVLMETNAVPMVDAAGTLLGYRGADADITESTRLESERQALELELRQQQRMVAVGTLARGVAHEISNPVMGILNYAQLIQDRPDDASAVREYAGEIAHEGERVTVMVRRLLSFSEQRKGPPQATRAVEIVNGVLPLVQATLKQDGIRVLTDIPEGLPRVHCQVRQVQRAVMDLLLNARDALNERYPGYHEEKIVRISAREIPSAEDATPTAAGGTSEPVQQTPDAGCSASPQPAAPPATVAGDGGPPPSSLGPPSSTGPGTSNLPPGSPSGRWLRLTIEDHGTGVTPAVRERLFDPFFSTKDRTRHSGLGLTVSRSAIADDGGRLSVESEPGQFTRFHVDLPVGAVTSES